jgi:hypothetical protein
MSSPGQAAMLSLEKQRLKTAKYRLNRYETAGILGNTVDTNL